MGLFFILCKTVFITLAMIEGGNVMEKQHEINSMGVIYIILLLGNIIICTISQVFFTMGKPLPSMLVTILCEALILAPVIIYLRSKGENIFERLGFHKIKFTTVLLTLLLTVVISPISIFANFLSQLFVPNTIVQSSAELVEGSAIITLIIASIIAPLCEEMTFRGFFFNGFKGTSSVIKAAIVSALLFGIMHLNLNQFCYAFVLGFTFALANHASKSTWTSVIMHVAYNFVNMSLLIIATLSLQEQNVDIAQAQESVRTQSGAMLSTIIIYGVLSIICAFLAWLLLKAIAKNQGNLEAFKASFAKKNSDVVSAEVRVHSLLNVPMMLSICIGVVAMIVYQVAVL